jgi:hypothetical protein
VASVAGLVLASQVLAPAADALALTGGEAALTPDRAANLAAQASLFTGIGMLLAAFVAAFAARIGGMRSEEMHLKPR